MRNIAGSAIVVFVIAPHDPRSHYWQTITITFDRRPGKQTGELAMISMMSSVSTVSLQSFPDDDIGEDNYDDDINDEEPGHRAHTPSLSVTHWPDRWFRLELAVVYLCIKLGLGPCTYCIKLGPCIVCNHLRKDVSREPT